MKRPDLFFTRHQSRLVDQLAIAAGTPGIELMENAALGCVHLLLHANPRSVVICAGTGNNGGDGFAMAKLLQLHQVQTNLILVGEKSSIIGDAAMTLQRLDDLPILEINASSSAEQLDTAADLIIGSQEGEWIIDAMLGTGATGDPRSPCNEIISYMNVSKALVMAIDVPSGLDCDTGKPGSPTVNADITCTFVTQKIGFLASESKSHLGEVGVIDIGVSEEIIKQVANTPPETGKV